MNLSGKYLIAVCGFLILIGCVRASDTVAPGFLEGHLRIFSQKEVELAGASPSKFAGNYPDYPLIILTDGGKRKSRSLRRTGTEITAFRCRRVTISSTCKGVDAGSSERSGNRSPLPRIRPSASIWISTPAFAKSGKQRSHSVWLGTDIYLLKMMAKGPPPQQRELCVRFHCQHS